MDERIKEDFFKGFKDIKCDRVLKKLIFQTVLKHVSKTYSGKSIKLCVKVTGC
jgi:hypothetical protein